MGVARRHTLYGVELASTTLGGIRGQAIETDTNVNADTSSGDIYVTHLAMNGQMVRARFDTTSLAVALGVCGLTGMAITDSDDVVMYAYKLAEGAGRAAGSVHRSYTFNEGIVVPRRITCSHQEDARIEYDVLPTYDGTNDPVVVADSAAVPTQGADNARFTIGGCTLESLAIGHITSFELDFGILAEQEGADSDKWPTHVAIQEAKPVLRLRGTDIEWAKSTVIPTLQGKVVTHANTTVFLRKRSAATATGFVANGTAQHIKFTFEGLAYIETIFDGRAEGNPPAEVSLVMPLRYDGTNVPVVVDTAAAIA